MPRPVAIVPAFNEEQTVASVVQALRAANAFDAVIVVDDGSSDDTSGVARRAGATVVRTPRNLGKGGAMLYAYKQIPNTYDRVAWFDADLIGFRPYHAQRLVRGSDLGYDQVAGLRDKGTVLNFLMTCYMPLITGERIVRRWILDALPESCWSGYSIETAINFVCRENGGRILMLQMDGVGIRDKTSKVGVLRGLNGHAKMLKEMYRTHRALRRSGGLRCAR